MLGFRIMLVFGFFADFPVFPNRKRTCFSVSIDDIDSCGLLYAKLPYGIIKRDWLSKDELNQCCFGLNNEEMLLLEEFSSTFALAMMEYWKLALNQFLIKLL